MRNDGSAVSTKAVAGTGGMVFLGRWLFGTPKRLRGFRAVAAVIVLSGFPFTSCYAMYKCVGAYGNVSYQESPCANSTQAQPIEPPAPQLEAPPPSSDVGVDQPPPENTPVPGTPPPMLQQPAPAMTNGASGDGSSPIVNERRDYHPSAGAIGVFAVPLAILILFIIGRMAHRRNRSAANWIVLSFLINPLLCILLLLVLGDAD